jgi:maltoporin
MTQPDPQPPAPQDPPAPAPAADDKTFTQADVDRMIAERLKRAKPADYDDLKAKAQQFDDLQAANASQLEKAVKAARDDGRAEVLTAANARLVTAEARALAAEMQFRKPAHAVRLIDLNEVTVGDDGEVDTAAVRKLLDDLAKDDPLLLVVPDDGRPKGDVDQGVRERATSTNPRQADLDQIEADMAASRRK